MLKCRTHVMTTIMASKSSSSQARRTTTTRGTDQPPKPMVAVLQTANPRRRRQMLAAPMQSSSRAEANHDSSSRNWESFPITVHCRHGEASPQLTEYVHTRVTESLLPKLRSGEFVEAEGGISGVDVKLMSTQAVIDVFPRQLNKNVHDTFLRQGEIKAMGQDANGSGEAGMRSCFDLAMENLEHKLKRQTKGTPRKVDMHKGGRGAATGRG